MKTITCVHTGMGKLPELIEKEFGNAVEDVKFYHILDSGLIGDIIAHNGITPKITDRLNALFTAAAGTNPDIIVSTCSSIGEAAEHYAAAHSETRILRIDYPMARYAVENAKKIAVLATLATTVEPSCRLVQRLAKEMGKTVEVISATALDAFDAMRRGDNRAATEDVVKTAQKLCADVDIILLAQASMSNFVHALKDALGEDTIMLDSPSTCAAYLKENL